MAYIYRLTRADEQSDKTREIKDRSVSRKRQQQNDDDNDKEELSATQVDVMAEELTGDKDDIERMSKKGLKRKQLSDEEKQNKEAGDRFDRRYRTHDDGDNDDIDGDEVEFDEEDINTRRSEQQSFQSYLNRRQSQFHDAVDHDISTRIDDDNDKIQIVYVGDDDSMFRRESLRQSRSALSGEKMRNSSMSAMWLGCVSMPCWNNAECLTDVTLSRGFRCRCPRGFRGEFCQLIEVL